MFVQFGASRLELTLGDIMAQVIDAIVNAANAHLAGGGGVDGAIHKAAGPALLAETRRLYPEGCPPGSAVATSAGRLAAKYVFHAVGPIWRGGGAGEPELLAGVHRCCLNLAVEHGCRGIAFPAISTGIYGYPMDLAAEAALGAAREFLRTTEAGLLVRFVLFDEGALGAYARVLESMLD